MKTKERLAFALKEADAPQQLIDRALAGQFDDFESDSATPINDLVTVCRSFGLHGLAKRAMGGEFDSTKEESEAWWKKEGHKLLGKNKIS